MATAQNRKALFALGRKKAPRRLSGASLAKLHTSSPVLFMVDEQESLAGASLRGFRLFGGAMIRAHLEQHQHQHLPSSTSPVAPQPSTCTTTHLVGTWQAAHRPAHEQRPRPPTRPMRRVFLLLAQVPAASARFFLLAFLVVENSGRMWPKSLILLHFVSSSAVKTQDLPMRLRYRE